MKLIIDIPKNVYEWVMNTGTFGIYRFDTAKAIKNGTPLDDVKANITEEYKLESESLYGNGMRRCLEIIDKHMRGET